MKHVIIAAMLMAPGVLCAQGKPFTIKGQLKETATPAKVYLTYKKGGKSVRDSAVVQHGAFAFKGTVNEPKAATLMLQAAGEQPHWLKFYLDKATISVVANDAFEKAIVKGTAAQQEYEKLLQMLKPVAQKESEMIAAGKAVSAEEKAMPAYRAAREKTQDSITDAKRNVGLTFLKAYPNSVVGLDVLNDVGGFFPDAMQMEPLYKQLSPAVRATEQGKEYGAYIAKLKKTSVGAMAPVFTKNNMEGKPVSLADFRGKYVLVDFWASWCHPCRNQNPLLVKAYEKFKDKNFTMLGVSLDNERFHGAWLKAVADDKLTWPQVQDVGDNKAADIYSIQAIPQNFLIDPKGKIIAKNIEGEQLEAKLAEVLK